MEAWVTSVLEESQVGKCLVLGKSLRRVYTSKKLVVLVKSKLIPNYRKKLETVFDLVLPLLEEEISSTSESGDNIHHHHYWTSTDSAKLRATSLQIFAKICYLTPNCLILKNCDNIFRKYDHDDSVGFAVARVGLGKNGNDFNSDVMVLRPSSALERKLTKLRYKFLTDEENFNDLLKKFLQLQKFVEMEECFNLEFDLMDEKPGHGNSEFLMERAGAMPGIVLVNGLKHPLDFPEKTGCDCYGIEKCVLDYIWKLHAGISTISKEIPASNLEPEIYHTEPVAIVGMSFRLPGANNCKEFWNLLENGLEGITKLPSHRWRDDQVLTPCKNRDIHGGFLHCPVDEFDAKFFGVSPKDAEFLDPQLRLLLEVTWECLEDALIRPEILRGSQTGIFVGSWLDDYKYMCSTTSTDFFRIYTGNSLAALGARLANFLKTTGPTIATESGCSSAMAVVDLACKSLRQGDSNVALACGVNLLLRPFDYSTINVVLSKDGRCRAFDQNAGGFGRAEACTVLVLKRLSDAVRDQDNIWGLIRGTAVTQEGVSTNLGTPTVTCESLAMELALKDANVRPAAISYLETHGTGTAMGDPIEIGAITRAYHSPERNSPLIIGSVKTNVGHTESASGITGIIKVLLSMRHQKIPRHLHFTEPGIGINLEAIPAVIPTETLEWPRGQSSRPRIAGVSSFGFSGTDGHAIIEEPPHPDLKIQKILQLEERPLHIMKISAASPESFDKLLQAYEKEFEQRSLNEGEENFANFAYSANIGRQTFSNRAAVIAGSFQDALECLRKSKFSKRNQSSPTEGQAQNLCFLFPGQGSQYPGMARILYGTSPVFRAHFDHCDGILSEKYGIFIKEAMWSGGNNNNDLKRTLYSQPSIFVVEYCLLKLWESWGVRPDYVMGHSLGEFVAAVAAHILTLDDALMLVAERSRLVETQCRHGNMLVVRADKSRCDQLLEEFNVMVCIGQRCDNFWLDFAAINTEDQTVLTGDPENILEFSKFCESKFVKSLVLEATHAFHSRHMDSILDQYQAVISKISKSNHSRNVEAPKFISGVTGKIVESEEINDLYWIRHTRDPVKFLDACKNLQDQESCGLFLEIGPHPILSAMVMTNSAESSTSFPMTCLPSLRRKDATDWNTLLESLSKLYLSDWKSVIDWEGFDQCYHRQKVPHGTLPLYVFNRRQIWKEVDGTPGEIHPILGRFIPTSSNGTIFEKRLTSTSVTFAEDHVIGNSVVFPGAGFLEMALAAGVASSSSSSSSQNLGKPRKPVSIRKLRIVAPLGLSEKICRLQTSFTMETEKCDANNNNNDLIGYDIQICRLLDPEQNSKWITHATCRFLPVSMETTSNVTTEILEDLNISEATSTWENFDPLMGFYEKLPEAGLSFGPLFQSHEMEWFSPAGDEMLTQLKTIPAEDDDPGYMLHPVIGDAMLQSLVIWRASKDQQKLRRLAVPVEIGEVTWFKPVTSTTRLYTYCKNDHCYLMDSDGSIFAVMSGVEFVETSAAMIEALLQQQENPMPKLWQEIWKSCPGPLEGSYNFQDSLTFTLTPEDLKSLQGMNELPPEEMQVYQRLCSLTRFYFLEAFYKLGWSPQENVQVTLDDLLAFLPSEQQEKIHVRRYISYFLRSLCQEGVFRMEGHEVKDSGSGEIKDIFYFEGHPPTLEGLQEKIRDLRETPEISDRIDWKLTVQVGDCLDEILAGKVEPLQVLFTKDPSKVDASKLYETMMTSFQEPIRIVNEGLVRSFIRENTKNQHGNGGILRILEIGAGTGSWSRVYLKFLESLDLPFEYHYTDVSAAFFNSAEKEFSGFNNPQKGRKVIFRKYDMERDPLSQGFNPSYFDIICASEVLHVAKFMKKTLSNIRMLLKSGGLFQIMETISPDPRPTFSFGLLEGYWNYQDLEFRRHHTTLTPSMWREALNEVGLGNVEILPLYNNVHGLILAVALETETSNMFESTEDAAFFWLIFYDDVVKSKSESDFIHKNLRKKLESVGRQIQMVPQSFQDEITETDESVRKLMRESLKVDGTEKSQLEGIVYLWGYSCGDSHDPRDQSGISLSLVTLLQTLSELEVNPRIYIVTKGAACCNGGDVIDPSAGTLGGIIRSMKNENSSSQCVYIDVEPSDMNDVASQVFSTLWSSFPSTVAFREGKRLTPKCMSSTVANSESLELPTDADRFQLILPKTKLLNDLEFSTLDQFQLQPGEVEVSVKCMGLNLVDLFSVLKPIAQFEKINTVGVDFAGVVSKVPVSNQKPSLKPGDRVMGIKPDPSLSLPSHLKVAEKMLVRIPQNLTFSEAVTLPIGFSTAVMCLIQAAQMKPGESVLVHTASGGVGLCAIQLARQLGASQIIATAGSERKRRYLREVVGIQHVFNSRTLEFGQKVLEITGGHGIDIVVNSLTGEGFKEASLQTLKNGGKFIEMSKLNVWSDEDVKNLRPDILYKIVDFATLTPEDIEVLLRYFNEYMEANKVKPIAYQMFESVNIRGALGYMQQAKHIGKIVVTMPEVKVEKSRFVWKTNLFNEDSTYLVTGGLGGIGFEVVRWMLENGAKYVTIASRSAPKSEVKNHIDQWNKEEGKSVQAFQVDVGDLQSLQNLFAKINQNPAVGFPKPLRGVMHVAGVLSNGIMENQTWEKFRFTFNSKLNGSWNLHNLTKNLLLEHFVLFSSFVSMFGSPGQSNHCASCSFEDSLASYRRSLGLPATTINWGNWGEVGVATEIDFPGLRPISNSQGLLALESFLKTQTSHLAVLNIDSFKDLSKVFPGVKHYFEDKRLFGGDSSGYTTIKSAEFWAKVNAEDSREGKIEIFKQLIKTLLRNLLRLDADELIGDLTDFRTVGMDSLMMLEMKNGLQHVLVGKITLRTDQLKECSNTLALATKLVDILLEGGDSPEHRENLIPEELKILIEDDAKLPEDIKPQSQYDNCNHGNNNQDVNVVLLTGATGTLGPYILKELCKNPNVTRIYALVRKTGGNPKNRLLKRLQHLGLDLDEADLEKLSVVEGDVGKDNFGISDDILLQELRDNVDAVLHCAVRMDHLQKYYRAPKGSNHVREVNVLGTQRILQFACEGSKLKQVLSMSTILSITGQDSEGNYSEDWQDIRGYSEMGVNCGYPISKAISEELVRQAISRGVPAKVMRLPYISGESSSGRCDYQSNHFILRWLTFLRLGCMPESIVPFFAVAVDTCASIATEIFFNKEAPPDVYNVLQMEVETEEQAIRQVAREEFGVTVDILPYQEFMERLKNEDSDSPIKPFMELYEGEAGSFMKSPANVRILQKCMEVSQQGKSLVMRNDKVSKYVKSEAAKRIGSGGESLREIVKRDMNYLKSCGIFEKFQIKSSH